MRKLQTLTAKAWADLYAANSARVLQYLRRLIGAGPASAEDLTHEVFVIAFANWHDFRGSSQVSTWLCGIAFNLARRQALRDATATRALSQLAACGLLTGSAELLPDIFHSRREQETALHDVSQELPNTLQDAFVLHCLCGVPAQEAALELGVSEGNLRVRVARARAFVRERLAQRRLLE
jgi:RNA polymerase sigma factor (sigma-70 family)